MYVSVKLSCAIFKWCHISFTVTAMTMILTLTQSNINAEITRNQYINCLVLKPCESMHSISEHSIVNN